MYAIKKTMILETLELGIQLLETGLYRHGEKLDYLLCVRITIYGLTFIKNSESLNTR